MAIVSDFTHIVESLPSNPWISFLSIILAVLSILVTVFIYIKSKREKKPLYSSKSNNIFQGLSGKFKPLKIHFNEDSIGDLTVTKICFWNGGKETINSHDIPTSSPLKLTSTGDYKILDANILEISNKSNNFRCSLSSDLSEVPLFFDYIDKNDGVVIQLMHTGKSGDDIIFEGIVKGSGTPAYKKLPDMNPYVKVPFIGNLPLSVRFQQYAVSILTLLFVIWFDISLVLKSQFLIGDIIFFGFSNLVLIYFSYYILQNLSPGDFTSFYEDD
ncbi:hypothetical protein V7O61_12505 [Methanolobus sp. WCC1]|uniref:hypothetical protein n=1 Tax=unclassified Methanolobus TaxID=2629569 RepID=UPI00324E6622